MKDSANATSIKYVYLTATGDSMFPTIAEGDVVKVKICIDGDIIKAGFQNSSQPGDIIVYCAGVAITYNSRLTNMWIGHRAIKKYMKNGEWYFKTKGDNNPKTDPWEVPEHFLLGVVVQILHRGPVRNKSYTLDVVTEIDNTLKSIGDVVLVFLIAVALCGIAIKREYLKSGAL
jgi:signal peptidase I